MYVIRYDSSKTYDISAGVPGSSPGLSTSRLQQRPLLGHEPTIFARSRWPRRKPGRWNWSFVKNMGNIWKNLGGSRNCSLCLIKLWSF